MNQFYVYQLRNLVNGKLYFGKGKKNRCNDHFKDALKNVPKSLIARSIKKYGKDNFELTKMMCNLTEIDAFKIEIFYIARFKTNVYKFGFECGYNQTDGGEGSSGCVSSMKGKHFGPDFCERARISHLNQFPNRKDAKHSEETKQILRDKRKLQADPRLGKKHSTETIQKMSLIKTGQPSRKPINPNAKLLVQNIDSVLNRIQLGESKASLAREFSLSNTSFNRVVLAALDPHTGPRYLQRFVDQE